MKSFIVFRREVWTQGVRVQATDQQEAIRKAADCDGDVMESIFEYSHMLDPETWTVEEREE